MDKQGALYFKLLTGIFLLVLIGYGFGRIQSRNPSYELYSTRICEVGDGITVSGFVVRSESVLYSRDLPTFLYEEGQWIGGGQGVALTPMGSLRTSQGGYLSYQTDGYEALLTPDFILRCTKEQFLSLKPEAPTPYGVGKLIHSQTWYFAVPGDFPDFSFGSEVSFTMGELTCVGTVLRTQGVLVLECDRYGQCITDFRQEEAFLQTTSFKGIPLPAKSLYYQDGESCVYILQGAQARRKTLRILHIRGDILWVHPEDLPQGSQVILTEKEITDGMVLK